MEKYPLYITSFRKHRKKTIAIKAIQKIDGGISTWNSSRATYG